MDQVHLTTVSQCLPIHESRGTIILFSLEHGSTTSTEIQDRHKAHTYTSPTRDHHGEQRHHNHHPARHLSGEFRDR